MKISFFSFAVNDKFPIDIMHRQFKKYIKEDFDFILFNDAYENDMEQNINLITSSNNIKCVRVPQRIHQSKNINPSQCYANVLNWATHEYAVQNNCEIIVLIHSDIFPICNVSILDIIGENIVASTTEYRLLNNQSITYFYPAFTIINMNKLKDPNELNFDLDDGLDTGGKTKDFIKNNINYVKFIPNHQAFYFLNTLSADDKFAQYFKRDLDICRSHGLNAGWIAEGFYHYMTGSQWNDGNSIFANGNKKRHELFLEYFY